MYSKKQKVIMITGATDGLGLATSKALAAMGHKLLLHGRASGKLAAVEAEIKSAKADAQLESYRAELTDLAQVAEMAKEVSRKHHKLDILINNAGVFSTSQPRVPELGMDSRFVVNSIAPYLLTKLVLPVMSDAGRVVNLSSAAQSAVNLKALQGEVELTDSAAYAQSKLAITMWSRYLASQEHMVDFIAVNPKSFLASKMVQQAYGMVGTDISAGVDILVRAAVSEEFSRANGLYFDNDIADFTQPHADALDMQKCSQVVKAIDSVTQEYL